MSLKSPNMFDAYEAILQNPEFLQDISIATEIAGRTSEDHGFIHPHPAVSLALIHSEVSEALEELRKTDISHTAVCEELADIVIRVLDFVWREGYDDFREALVGKMSANIKRPYRHNKRF